MTSNLKPVNHPSVKNNSSGAKLGDFMPPLKVKKERKEREFKRMPALALHKFMEDFPHLTYSSVGNYLGISGGSVASYARENSMPPYIELALAEVRRTLNGDTSTSKNRTIVFLVSNELLKLLDALHPLCKQCEMRTNEAFGALSGPADQIEAVSKVLCNIQNTKILEL